MKNGQQQKQKHKGLNQFAYLNTPPIKQLHQETRAGTQLAYRPTERAVNSEKRASQQRTKNIGNWWNEYLAEVGSQQAGSQQAYANAAQQTQGLINTGSQVDQANTSKLNAEQSAAAAARGQSATAVNAATTGTANAALSQRNTELGSIGSATAQRGADQYAYLGNQAAIGAGQRASAMTTQTKQTHKIEGDLTELRKERGEYASKLLGTKEAEARELALKRQAFSLEKHSAAAGAAAEAAKAQREYEEFLAEHHHDEREAGTNAYKAHHPSTTSSGGLTPSERNAAKTGKENALSTVHSFIASHGYPKDGAAKAELEREVAKESEVSPADASWAVNRYLKRHPKQVPAGPGLGKTRSAQSYGN